MRRPALVLLRPRELRGRRAALVHDGHVQAQRLVLGWGREGAGRGGGGRGGDEGKREKGRGRGEGGTGGKRGKGRRVGEGGGGEGEDIKTTLQKWSNAKRQNRGRGAVWLAGCVSPRGEGSRGSAA